MKHRRTIDASADAGIRNRSQAAEGSAIDEGDIVRALLEALDQHRAPEGIALADLMRIEAHLTDSLRIVRTLIDAVVRREGSGL